MEDLLFYRCCLRTFTCKTSVRFKRVPHNIQRLFRTNCFPATLTFASSERMEFAAQKFPRTVPCSGNQVASNLLLSSRSSCSRCAADFYRRGVRSEIHQTYATAATAVTWESLKRFSAVVESILTGG